MSTPKPCYLRFAVVWMLLCFGTLLLFAGFYWWLTWPDEHFWQVCASFLWAAMLLIAMVCLVRTLLAAAAAENGLLPRLTFLSCVATAFWMVVFAGLELAIAHLDDGAEAAAVRFAQILHLPPRMSISLLHNILLAAMWLLLPALFLPLGSRMASGGSLFLRRSSFVRVLRNYRYWAGLVGAVGLCYLSRWLIDWLPERRTLHGELTSAGWRLGLAYLLGISAMVIAAWITGRARLAAETQSSPTSSTAG